MSAAISWAKLAVVAGLCLVGCTSSPAPPATPLHVKSAPSSVGDAGKALLSKTEGRDSDSRVRRNVEEMLQRVATIRGLPPRAAVESRVLPRTDLLARVRKHIDEQVPRDVMVNQGEFLVALGLIAPDFDYEAGTLSLLEGQLAGFFEPKDKIMYLAADLRSEIAFATLAHELVHALQDQHFELGRKLSYQPHANDFASAIQSLAEGDATSAMMDVMLADTGKTATDLEENILISEIEASMSIDPSATSAPRVLRASLMAPYVDGIRFVHALRRRGGWKAVDDVWLSPPETTEQLLHPDKLDAREKAEQVQVPAAPDPNGWNTVYDDVFGEQGVRIAVEEWVPRGAAEIAAGWAGDRAALYSQGLRFAAAWHLRFDRGGRRDEGVWARRAFGAIAAAIGRRAANGSVCKERGSLGPLALALMGRDLVLVAGPYRREGGRVSSDAVCAQSARWAADILGRRSR